MVGDTILIKDISINGNDELKNASDLSKKLTDNTINALGIDASSRTIWINGQPYGNAYVNVKTNGTLEKPIGGEIFNDFTNNVASGEYSHAEGHVTSATNANAHAEGTGTTASGIASHSEGYYSTASGAVSHAEGYQTTATNTGSHAEGNQTHADGVCSHTEGFRTQTTNKGEHAEGLSNISIKDKTIHTVGIGTDTDDGTDRKNAEEIHYNTGDKYVIGIGGYDGTNSVEADVKTVQTVVNESINQITISYLKLKELRDTSQLVPGKEYRINDYICTTTQPGTRSAGNVFDIIVTADSESTLNEEARAIRNDNDNNYFKDCDLNAWKLWYCLDNDTTRFAWADETNGKGVIYRMIDEWNNDVPYDFKNIQYNGSWGYWAYTFNWINDEGDNSYEDLSVAQYAHTNYEGGYSHTYDNVIKPCELGEANYGVPFKLNACVFLNTESYEGGAFNGCYNNVFGNGCNDNTFGNGCSNNTFGNGCSNNTFGNGCSNNTFGNGCSNNFFGNGCSHNAVGNNCQYNTFGENCYGNSFGENCNRNSFGDSCHRNSFGAHCDYNSVGNCCDYIIFAVDSSASTKYDYYRHNHFGDGCEYILFMGKDIDVDYQRVQNYNFAQGVQGTDSAYLTIDGVRNRAYETYISRDTDGTIKESVIADKLDKMIEITYKELYDLREANGLIPGQQYRITDYECTINTSNMYIKAQTDKFDIVVTAVSTNKLNEEARVINHEFTAPNQDHFKDCKLSAWKIWYCLDNDITRFAWADATKTNGSPNGKGVIYRMIDEFDNDCPYDFKNIQFYRKKDETTSLWSIISLGTDDGVKPCYTFSSEELDSTGKFTDMSLNKDNNVNVYSNVIKKYNENIEITNSAKQTLNNICFFGKECYNNFFGNDCYDSTFGKFCSNNTFGKTCHNNVFGNIFNNNIFGSDCSYNTFGYGCAYNTFGNNFGYKIDYSKRYGNSFGDNCEGNSFGNSCGGNNFGSACSYNTFGNYCRDNIFRDNCVGNSVGNYFGLNPNDSTNNHGNNIGNNCVGNSFGNSCFSNVISSYCVGNTFGEKCYLNNLCKGCDYNSFGNNCINIKLFHYGGYDKNKHYQYNHFGDGCYNIGVCGPTENVSDSDMVQNYNFAQGLRPDVGSPKFLTINTQLNLTVDTTISKGTDNKFYEYCLADVAVAVGNNIASEQIQP